jgi:hypothetical protein
MAWAIPGFFVLRRSTGRDHKTFQAFYQTFNGRWSHKPMSPPSDIDAWKQQSTRVHSQLKCEVYAYTRYLLLSRLVLQETSNNLETQCSAVIDRVVEKGRKAERVRALRPDL